MAFRIAYTGDKPGTGTGRSVKRQRVKLPDYLAWLHTLPCPISGSTIVEAAHVSYPVPELGKFYRGKGEKVNDRWAIPLAPALHREQGRMNEREFWLRQGIDPVITCLALFGAYHDGDHEAAEEIIRMARKEGDRHG